jgi:hypothetical protein
VNGSTSHADDVTYALHHLGIISDSFTQHQQASVAIMRVSALILRNLHTLITSHFA